MAPKRLLAQLLIGSLLAASSAAYAQGGPHGGQPGKGPAMQHPGKGSSAQAPGRQSGHPGAQRPGHNGPSHGNRGRQQADPPYQHWSKGERVPLPYRGPQYVVNDWRGHKLAPPPRGYHWIGVGADYFLVGVATGIVLEALMSR